MAYCFKPTHTCLNVFRRFNVIRLVHLGFIGLQIHIAYKIRPWLDAIYSPCTIGKGTDTGPQASHSCVPTLRQICFAEKWQRV